MITCELDLTPNTFSDTTILTYEIELPPSGKKIGLYVLDDEYFIIPYVIDTIPNSPSSNHLQTWDKKDVWSVAINGEETITYQDALDRLQKNQT